LSCTEDSRPVRWLAFSHIDSFSPTPEHVSRENESMRGFSLLAVGVLCFAAPKQLLIETPAFHQYEDGPDLPADFRFTGGETVYFDFQVANYRRAEDDKVSLTWNAEVKDGSGVPVIVPQFGKVMTQLTAEDKKWQPRIRLEIPIPPHALTGTYKIAVLVTDDLAKTTVAREFTFPVRGHEAIDAPALEILGVGFYRSEDAPKPLPAAAFAPGDTLWIRFEIEGFKLAEQNRYDVSYGIQVLRASGEPMFSQDEAAAERGESFYPRRYVPAGLSLNLQKDLRPGEYTVVITVRDRVGNQTAESRQTFSVRTS
jgi:hypothetical protein